MIFEEESGGFEVVDTFNLIMMSIALVIIAATVLTKRKDLIKYFGGFVAMFFAYMFQSFEEGLSLEIFVFLMHLFLVIAASIFVIAVIIDYYSSVLNKSNEKKDRR